MTKDQVKGDILPPPPMGKTFGHGLINKTSTNYTQRGAGENFD